MWEATLIQYLSIVLIWVGLWGIIEIIVDFFAKNNTWTRIAIYFLLVVIGVFSIWILYYNIE
jgi:predicted membrane channel-forming protein YqfA (hemolysin III family)